MKSARDIVISGAGPAGMIAAASLARTGLSIMVVDPSQPVTDSTDQAADWRSTAFLRPAIELFEHSGLWPTLSPSAQPLRALRIVDLAGDPPAIRDERCFVSDADGQGPFGWNFLNWKLRDVLLTHLSTLDNVDLVFGASVTGLHTRSTSAQVRLSDGRRIDCRLAIAADGRNSSLRDAAGIRVSTTRYGQKSLAFAVTHDVPHDDISTEIYLEGGPFTMVPLADIDGRPASAIVWMNKGTRSAALLNAPAGQFESEMLGRSAGLFGPLRLASPRGMFPIITQRAERLTSERVAVIAEAAHVLPPIGAQGLNTSVNDILALTEAILAHADDPGSETVLSRYESSRSRDIAMRARAIDLFNRVTRSGLPALQSLRLNGLRLAHDFAPLRRGLVRAGMGPLQNT